MLSRIPYSVELSHDWLLTYFKHKEPEFYARLFYDYEEDPFKVTSGCTQVYIIRKPLYDAPRFFILWDKKSA